MTNGHTSDELLEGIVVVPLKHSTVSSTQQTQ